MIFIIKADNLLYYTWSTISCALGNDVLSLKQECLYGNNFFVTGCAGGFNMTRSGATSNEYTSNISRTKSQNLNVSDLVLMLSLSNPLKPGVKSRMKMWLEHRRQAMLQIHLSDRLFYCLLRATYVRGLTVFFYFSDERFHEHIRLCIHFIRYRCGTPSRVPMNKTGKECQAAVWALSQY